MKKQVPLAVTMVLQGPSDDFIVARIFEGAMRDAYDDIVKNDDNGMPLEMSNWIMDNGLRAQKAKTKYQTANCELIQ